MGGEGALGGGRQMGINDDKVGGGGNGASIACMRV